MPTSRYSWLKQEQAKERKDENNQLEQMRRNMAVIGGDDSFANRYGGKRLGNTGYGEDGVLQPSMPTQIVGTGAGPQMLHEGEDVRVMPNGAIQVNPASQSTPQTQLAGMERPSGMPGMAMGGRIELKNLANRVSGVGAAVGNMLTAMRSNPAGLETPLTNLPFGNASSQVGNMLTAMRSNPAGLETPLTNLPLTPRPVASNPTDAAGNQIGSGGPATAFVAPLDQIGGATVRPPEAPDTTSDNYLLTADDNSLNPEQLARKQWLQNESGARWAAAAPTPKMDAAGNILGQNVPTAPDAADVPPVTPNPPPTLGTQAGTYWGRGMQRLERTAEGQDPFAERIRLAEQGRFAAEEQAARGSQAQEAAQQGLTGTEFLTEKAMLGQQIGSKENELMLGLRKQEQANALQAAGQIPGEARSMMGEQRAQDAATREANAVLEADTAGYLTTINGDWRNDPVAQSKLQKAWEANGNTGTFDPAWADNFATSVRMTPADRWYNDFTTSRAYLDAPETTTYAADGVTPVTIGRDLLNSAATAIRSSVALGTMAIGKGPNGGVCVYNPADGTIVSGDGAGGRMPGIGINPNNPTVTTYDSTNPASVTAAVTAWTAPDAIGTFADGVTDNAMRQWLASHNNTLPATEAEWNTWNMSTRTYDVDNPDDVRAAYSIMDGSEEMDDYTGSFTSETVGLWLARNGGKIDDINSFKTWATDIGSPTNIHNFLRTPDDYSLDTNDDAMIARASLAHSLMAQKDTLTPDEFAQLATDNGFANVDEMEWYNDNVLDFGDATVPSIDITSSLGLSNTDYGDVINDRDNNGRRIGDANFNVRLNNQPNRTVIESVPDNSITTWATENAGKSVTINGATYILAPETDLLAYGGIGGGGRRAEEARWKDGKTYVPGFRAYDVANKKWVVISPQNWDNHMVDLTNDGNEIDCTTRLILRNGDWGVYPPIEGADPWTPTAPPAQ